MYGCNTCWIWFHFYMGKSPMFYHECWQNDACCWSEGSETTRSFTGTLTPFNMMFLIRVSWHIIDTQIRIYLLSVAVKLLVELSPLTLCRLAATAWLAVDLLLEPVSWSLSWSCRCRSYVNCRDFRGQWWWFRFFPMFRLSPWDLWMVIANAIMRGNCFLV